MSLENQLGDVKIPKDANVLAVCNLGVNRSPKLVGILREHGYQHADFVGVFIANPTALLEKIEWAKYIVTLDITAADQLKYSSLIKDGQVLIELDASETTNESRRARLKTSEQVYDIIRRQIAPYLSD